MQSYNDSLPLAALLGLLDEGEAVALIVLPIVIVM